MSFQPVPVISTVNPEYRHGSSSYPENNQPFILLAHSSFTVCHQIILWVNLLCIAGLIVWVSLGTALIKTGDYYGIPNGRTVETENNLVAKSPVTTGLATLNGWFRAAFSIGLGIDHLDKHGATKKQATPRLYARYRRISGVPTGDAGFEMTGTCGSLPNGTVYGTETTLMTMDCDAGLSLNTIVANVSVTTPVVNTEVLSVSGNLTSTDVVANRNYKIGDNTIFSLNGFGQVVMGNSSDGTALPSDSRGAPMQVLITNGAGISSWADEGGTIRTVYGNSFDTSALGASGGPTAFIVMTKKTAGTATSACDFSYFATAPVLTITIDVKDSAGVIVASTGSFTPTAGYNTIACNSFPATGAGKTLIAYYTIVWTSGSINLYSNSLTYAA